MSVPGRTGGSAGGAPTKPRCAADAGAPDRRQVRQGSARAERRAVTAGRKTRPPAGRRAAGRLDGAAARQRPKPGMVRAFGPPNQPVGASSSSSGRVPGHQDGSSCARRRCGPPQGSGTLYLVRSSGCGDVPVPGECRGFNRHLRTPDPAGPPFPLWAPFFTRRRQPAGSSAGAN